MDKGLRSSIKGFSSKVWCLESTTEEQEKVKGNYTIQHLG